MCEPSDDWRCKFDESSEPEKVGPKPNCDQSHIVPSSCVSASGRGDNDFSFPCGSSLSEDDDEVTESKIRAFLDEKVIFFWLESELSFLMSCSSKIYSTLHW